MPAGQTTATLCYDADYYPYGGEKVVTNTCPQNYKWTGKERDAETGNDDFDARYYSSTYGRFLSADWSAVPAPVPYANLTNPQTLNLYAIVRDNPESYADLDGHDPTPGEPGTGRQCNQYDNCTSPSTDAASQMHLQSEHTGAAGAFQDLLDIVEVSGSYGVGASVGGQAGTVEFKAGVGGEVEGRTGLGGGGREVSVFGGLQGSVKAGSAEAEIKAGASASTKDGVSASGEAHGAVGPIGGTVKADKTGVHVYADAQHQKDTKLGVHVQLVIGVGVSINLSQASRVINNTQQSIVAAEASLVNYVSAMLPTSTRSLP